MYKSQNIQFINRVRNKGGLAKYVDCEGPVVLKDIIKSNYRKLSRDIVFCLLS